MLWVGILIGGGGFLLSHRYRNQIDGKISTWMSRFMDALQFLFHAPPSPDEDLELTTRLVSSMKAGLSLDSALEDYHSRLAPISANRPRVRAILDRNPRPDPLSNLLFHALESGAPVLQAMQSFEKAFRAQRRLRQKARGLSSQCRAQAEVLTWLPWILGAALAVMDPQGFWVAAREPLPWLFWAFAIVLGGLGRRWIQSSIKKSLRPHGAAERFEEEQLPEIILGVISRISCGLDAESALQQSLAKAQEYTRKFFLLEFAHSTLGQRLLASIQHSFRTGGPIRDELTSFLLDLQSEAESRWEERVQRLPVMLLAPLFLCFFPGSLLVIAGLLFPLFWNTL